MTLPIVLDAALRGSVLVGIAAAAAALGRRTTAAHRHYVWTLTLGGLLALPLLSVALPWRLPVMPAITAPEGAAESIDMPASAAIEASNADIARIVDGISRTGDAVPPSAAPPVSARAEAPNRVASSHRSPSSLSFLVSVLRVVWIGGMAFAVARLIVGVLMLRWVMRDAREVSDRDWLDLLDSASERLDLKVNVRLFESPHANMPMAFGLIRPVVVLPMESDAWSSELREVVLLHELAHVRRRDVRANLVGQLACALYWFHPLVWTAARRLRIEAERACDDLVLGAGAPASAYAGHLLDMVQAAASMRAPAFAVPMAQPSAFEGRVLAILDPRLARHGVTRRAAAVGLFGLLVITVPLAALAPTQGQEPRRERVRTREVDRMRDAERRAEIAAQAQVQVQTELATRVNVQADARLRARESLEVARALQATSRELHAELRSAPELADLARLDALRAMREQRSSAQRGDPRVTAGLIALLEDGDADVRLAAIHTLGQRGDTAAVNALLNALRRDTSKDVRKTAAWALGQIEDASAVSGLLAALRAEEDREIRNTVAWALGQIESAQAVEGLGAALRSETDPETRRTIVWALGQIESKDAVPFLVPLLRDADAQVREKTVWALGQIESPAAVEPLMAMYSTERTPAVRQQILWALGQLEDARAVPIFEQALRDSSLEVRRKAIWAIGQVNNLHTAPAGLLAALRDPDLQIRRAAVHAVSQLEDPAAVPALIALMSDTDLDVRRSVVHALGEIPGSASAEALLRALRDPDPEIRRLAAHALGDR